MKGRWLMIALLLSLGINLGLVIGSLSDRHQQPAGDGGEATTREGVTATTGATPPSDPPTAGEPSPDRPIEGWPPRREPPPMLQRMADELGLDGELRQRFLAQQMRFLGLTLEGRRRIGELQNALRAEVTAENPDRRQIDQLLQESARVHYRLERAFVENLLAGREVLDEEQERRYFEMLMRFRRGRESRRLLERRWEDRGERRETLRAGPGLE